MLKTIKTILIVSIAVFLSFSCKKNKDTPAPNPAAEQIVLSAPIISGDSVRLTWTKLVNDSLEGYTINRVHDSLPGNPYSYRYVDRDSVNLTDYLSLLPYVQYYITATLTSGRTITSNKAVAARTGLNFIPTPTNVICDKSTNRLYISDQRGNVYQYDAINKTIINQVAVMQANGSGLTLGECCIDTFNGKRELYVPRSDGWLFIYDATTLSQIDQISVGTGFLYSVASNKGFLFISGDIGSSGLSIYKRATKSLVSSGGLNTFSYLRVIPRSNTKLITFDFNGVSICNISSNGTFTSSKQATVPINYTDGLIGVYPDGSKIIYSNNGTIYNDTFGYINALPLTNSEYTSFDFDTTNQLIYASNGNSTIQAYSMTDYHLANSINTKGSPQQVFYMNNSVICISNNAKDPYYPYQAYPVYFIEQF